VLLDERKNSKTHAQIYKADRQKFYCAVELPLSEYAHTATGYPQELNVSSTALNYLCLSIKCGAILFYTCNCQSHIHKPF